MNCGWIERYVERGSLRLKASYWSFAVDTLMFSTGRACPWIVDSVECPSLQGAPAGL